MEGKIVRGFRVFGRPAEGGFVPSPPTLGIQQPLFPFVGAQTVVFVHVAELSDEQFVSFLSMVGSAVVIELRAAPRFDVGHLDRRTVFEFFRKTRTVYCDLAPTELMMSDVQFLISRFTEIVKRHFELKKPFLCLVDRRENSQELITGILRRLANFDGAWQTCEYPAFGAPQRY